MRRRKAQTSRSKYLDLNSKFVFWKNVAIGQDLMYTSRTKRLMIFPFRSMIASALFVDLKSRTMKLQQMVRHLINQWLLQTMKNTSQWWRLMKPLSKQHMSSWLISKFQKHQFWSLLPTSILSRMLNNCCKIIKEWWVRKRKLSENCRMNDQSWLI